MYFPFQYTAIDNNVCFVLARVLHIVMHEEHEKASCCLVSASLFGRRAFVDGLNSSLAIFQGCTLLVYAGSLAKNERQCPYHCDDSLSHGADVDGTRLSQRHDKPNVAASWCKAPPRTSLCDGLIHRDQSIPKDPGASQGKNPMGLIGWIPWRTGKLP